MALNKRKILEAARKHAQKGAKAKALKEYNKLLKSDPRDAKLLLEVGDAYRRWGQAEEAIAQYGKVAQQYRQDGFDARAVAVFKQILNLDPKHYSAYVSLSELYQRMGLDAEAISALQTAADGYHKEGRKAEALDLLRQTAALDPTNTTSRLKVAELLRQEGMEAEALSEYKAVAEELKTQHDQDQLVTIQERILEIKPDELETLSSLVRNLMSSGDLDRAESFAVHALDVSAEPAQYELLMELYAQGGDEAKLIDATRGLAKLHRDRGDEEKARELMQRLPAEEVESSSRLAVDVSDIDEPDLGDEELLDEEPFLSLTDEHEVENDADDDEMKLELGAEDPQPGEAVEPEALPEGDPDQLLAEANVYLRYDKRDQAIASLRGVIAQDSNHRVALEKLGEAYADDGQPAKAVGAWKRAAVQLRQAGDAEAFAVLKDRIAALDPAAAEQIGSIDIAAPKAAEIELDLDVEVDLDLDHAIDEVASSGAESGIDFDAGGDDFEIELDDEQIGAEFESESASSEESAQGVSIDEETGGVSFVAGMESVDWGDVHPESESESADATVDAQEHTTDLDFDVDKLTDPPTGTRTSQSSTQSTTTAAKISEELEEAEFYLAQDMFDEAEVILARILEVVPNHPSAMLRMGEIAAARGSRPDPAAEGKTSEPTAEIPAEVTLDGTGNDFEATARLDEDESPDDADGDFEFDLDDDEEDTLTAHEPDGPPSVDGESTDASSPKEGSTVLAEVNALGDEDAGESFDLREALADVLGDDEGPSKDDSTSGVLSTVEDGFGSIFSDFKKGVSETLEEGDYETRYDLGIAYREMGLYEDAIGEFRICLDSAARRFDSLYLMGICARELSRFDDSVNYFEQALALPDIPVLRLAGVYFDLSIAQEGIGEIERACVSVRRVVEIDAGFPGAEERRAALEAGGAASPKLGEPGEVFESFDDLFDDDDDEGGDVAMVEAVPAETFESFDDVIEEAEAALEPDEAPPDPKADSHSARKTGRKRISFV